MLKFLNSFIIVALIAFPAWAVRPLETEDAETVDQGRFEIEEGIIVDQPRGESAATSTSMGTSVKYGILPNLDVGVEVPYVVADPTGPGDASVKGKVRVIDESEIAPSVAVGVNVKLNNADLETGLGSGYTDYGVHGIFTKDIGPTTGHINLGYTIIGQPEGADSENVLSYGVAIEYPIAETVNLMGEIIGESVQNIAPIDLQLGANLSINNTFTVDGGIGFGLTEDSSQYKGTVGLTVNM